MTEPSLIRTVSIDPGAVHNGVAQWLGAKCYGVREVNPIQLEQMLEAWLRADVIDELVVEEYRLYAWKSKEQAFGIIETVEVIGIIKHLCRRWSTITPIMQPASMKKPGFATAKGRGIEILGSNQHMRDAWVHGYVRITRR